MSASPETTRTTTKNKTKMQHGVKTNYKETGKRRP